MLIWPVLSIYPVSSDESDHLDRGEGEAWDFGRAEDGTPIAGSPWIACHDGHIAANFWDAQGGWMAYLQWFDGDRDRIRRARYAHGREQCQKSVGTVVSQGDGLGAFVGNTGLSTAPHLHWVLEEQQPDRTWLRLRPSDLLASGELVRESTATEPPETSNDMTSEEHAVIQRAIAVIENNMLVRAVESDALIKQAAVNLTPEQVAPLSEAIAMLAVLADECKGEAANLKAL